MQERQLLQHIDNQKMLLNNLTPKDIVIKPFPLSNLILEVALQFADYGDLTLDK